MEFYTKLQMKVELTKAGASSEMTAKYLEEISNKISFNNTYLKLATFNSAAIDESLSIISTVISLLCFFIHVLSYSPI